MRIDSQAQSVLIDLYKRFESNPEPYRISAPEYDQLQVDYLIKNGLLDKIDASSMSGWAYLVRANYNGKIYIKQLKEKSIIKSNEFKQQGEEIGEKETTSNKVFIVHGHDKAAYQEMARTLEKGGFEAIILREQPASGRTIIEQIEQYTKDVAFAVVLYTECDLGRAKEMNQKDEKYRARQNVVFEHGYLIAKLGRDHVCALVKGNVETPSDISGVVYVNMDPAGAWKMQLGKNMKEVKLPVDLNTFCS